jgi:CRP-like cAMP-binding protein
MRKNILNQLYESRFRGPDYIRKALNQPQRDLAKRQKKRVTPVYLKGVHKGNFFRIKIPPKTKSLPKIPELPPTNPMPQAFKKVEPTAQSLKEAADKGPFENFASRLYAWFRANLAILALNVGSTCTLIGFTRSDVLELRSFSVTGSLMFIAYNLGQSKILWPSICWTSLFAAVNSYKIFGILQERNAAVQMTDDQEDVFVEHFMPHGITPKQFEKIYKKAEFIKVKQGGLLIRTGEKLDHLYLVVKGTTQAHILGRHLTAASTTEDTKGDQKKGGDSGAWAGEMSFLDQFWEKEQAKLKTKKTTKPGDVEEVKDTHATDSKKALGNSLYTIIATKDCTVMRWSHEDMEELMTSSNDLRAALTRAMTSALVGKVVNLTISRSNKLPNWSTWLSDWQRNDGATIQLKNLQKLPEDYLKNTKPTAKPTAEPDPVFV